MRRAGWKDSTWYDIAAWIGRRSGSSCRLWSHFVIRNRATSHSGGVRAQVSALASVAEVVVDSERAGRPCAQEPAGPTLSIAPMTRPDPRLREAVGDYLPLVWRVLRRAGLGPADADDAAQDVFWVLAQRFDDVPARAQRSFLVSTALKIASDRRQLKWSRSVSSGLETETRPHDSPLPDEALDRRRAQALLDEALATLDPADRAVFVLAELEQMTRAEVAVALAIPEGTVASRLRRAREDLDVAVRRARALPRTNR